MTSYEALEKAKTKLKADGWHDKYKQRTGYDPLFKEYMKALIEAGETPEEKVLINQGLCIGLMMMNTSGLRGGF